MTPRRMIAIAMPIAMPTFLPEPWAWASRGDAVFASDVDDGDEVAVAVALAGRPVRSCGSRLPVGTTCIEVSKTTELVCCGAGDIFGGGGFCFETIQARGVVKRGFSLAYAVRRSYSICLVWNGRINYRCGNDGEEVVD